MSEKLGINIDGNSLTLDGSWKVDESDISMNTLKHIGSDGLEDGIILQTTMTISDVSDSIELKTEKMILENGNM